MGAILKNNDPKPKPDEKVVAGVVHRNIRTMLQLRQQAEQSKGIQYRFGNAITRFIGSLLFVGVQIFLVLGWILVNLGWISRFRPFDPYPFTLLSTLLTIEAIFIAIFILLNQNHMADLQQKREELDIQISLLTEQEVTEIMGLVDTISRHLRVKGNSKDLSDLKKETSPVEVLQEIEKEIGKMENSISRSSEKVP